MIAHAAVLCLVLFSGGRPAAASKSFGGGGYGAGESVGQKEPESWAGPLVTPPEVVIPKPVIPKPFIPKPMVGYSTPEVSVSYPAADSPPATPTPSKTSTNNKGYGSGTPSSAFSIAPEDKQPIKQASPAAAGNGGSSSSYGSGTPSSSSSSTAPEDKPKKQQASPAVAASGSNGGNGKYGLDPAGEPEYGLNQKAIDDILKEHNVFRAKEHVPPLTWNATLAKFSQQYAETLKSDCKMVHSTSPYGENLMLGSGGVTWKTTVDEWSDEKKSYHYGSNSCDAGKMCGHYTAVVWKGTTTVGCGRVVCNNGDTMIMCSYWPPGNYDGVKPF
ncbi:unnamed protein product [Urochloa decumbens]|uniref:SCP domain-containing protein n=1 Tax=Urochloa decumbens TaxID=240449 RepID=A0ABC8VY62_9POAL